MTDIIFLSKFGKIIRISASDVPLSSLIDKNGRQKTRKPVGVKVMDLKKGDELVDLCSLSELAQAETSEPPKK